MYGPPGCGRTMLAKAVAHHTTGKKYIRCVWSKASFEWLGLKYLGEGPRMVAMSSGLQEKMPQLLFIDKIDAIATKRFDAQTGG